MNRPSPGAYLAQLDSLRKYEAVSLMYYGNINPQILDYYSVQRSGKLFQRYMGKNYNSLWSQWDYSPEATEKIEEEIVEQFENSSAVIIPEFIDQYSLGQPYAINQNRDLFIKLFSEGRLPAMKIVDYIEENSNARLVVLRKFSDGSHSDLAWKPIMRSN